MGIRIVSEDLMCGITIVTREIHYGITKEKYLKSVRTGCRKDSVDIKKKKASYLSIRKSYSTARIIHE